MAIFPDGIEFAFRKPYARGLVGGAGAGSREVVGRRGSREVVLLLLYPLCTTFPGYM